MLKMKSCWFLAIATLLFVGCQTQESVTKTETPTAEADTYQEVPQDTPQIDKQRQKIEAFVEKNADSFVSYAMRSASPHDLSEKIKSLVAQSNASKRLKSDDYGDLRLPGLKQADYLKAIYESRQFAPLFIENGKLSHVVSIATQTFAHLDERAITPKMLDATAFNKAVQMLSSENTDAETEPFALNEDEKKIIADELEKRKIDIAQSSEVKKIIDDALMEGSTLLPRLQNAVKSASQNSLNHANWAALADVLLADHMMTYARIVKFSNRTHLSKDEQTLLGKNPAEKNYNAIADARTTRWFGSISNVTSKEAFDENWNALYPSHNQYERLVEAHRKYAALPDWKKVKSGKLKAQKPSDIVPALKLRLALEGYYKGDVSQEAQQTPEFKIYDNEIRAAVTVFHHTHQIDYDERKPLEKAFWTSLNKTREERLKVIDENIRRWYGTYLVPSDYYIYVNVPDFHGEVWKDGKRIHRFPVVAGSARKSCHPETKQWYYINATPLMHSHMSYLEYNPYWIVPGRIEQEDYIQKINADPTWLETHGFEYYTENNRTMLRQLPGENNALGRVKFIFPNEHATFLHDSPQKRFFKYSIRAFSHGCMRVWEPLKLAEILLKNDGQWYNGIAQEIEDFQTRRYVLKNKFDVFIDYFTVRVDDDGLVYFLADPYHYVKDALNPPTEKQLTCTPAKREKIERISLQQEEDVGTDESTGVD